MPQGVIIRDLLGAELGRFKDFDEFVESSAEFGNLDVELEFVPADPGFQPAQSELE